MNTGPSSEKTHLLKEILPPEIFERFSMESVYAYYAAHLKNAFSQNGSEEVKTQIKSVIEHSPGFNSAMLKIAMQQNDVEVLKLLLLEPFVINYARIGNRFLNRPSPCQLELLIEWAALQGHLEIINYVVENHSPPNEFDINLDHAFCAKTFYKNKSAILFKSYPALRAALSKDIAPLLLLTKAAFEENAQNETVPKEVVALIYSQMVATGPLILSKQPEHNAMDVIENIGDKWQGSHTDEPAFKKQKMNT